MTAMPRAKNTGQTQVSVLLPDEVVERLDALAAAQSEPGVRTATRAEMLRGAVMRGLVVLEGEGKRGRK
jgi:predicted DNA-binding protein